MVLGFFELLAELTFLCISGEISPNTKNGSITAHRAGLTKRLSFSSLRLPSVSQRPCPISKAVTLPGFAGRGGVNAHCQLFGNS